MFYYNFTENEYSSWFQVEFITKGFNIRIMWIMREVPMYESFQWFKEPIDYVPYIESEFA